MFSEIESTDTDSPSQRGSLENASFSFSELDEKDEEEIQHIIVSKVVNRKKVHNKMTNRFLSLFPDQVVQGRTTEAQVDIVLKNYDQVGNDLFIEVKSSSDVGSARMAIGQVLDYWCYVRGLKEPRHIAICLLGEPMSRIKALTNTLGIGLLWFDKQSLNTSTKSLQHLAKYNS